MLYSKEKKDMYLEVLNDLNYPPRKSSNGKKFWEIIRSGRGGSLIHYQPSKWPWTSHYGLWNFVFSYLENQTESTPKSLLILTCCSLEEIKLEYIFPISHSETLPRHLNIIKSGPIYLNSKIPSFPSVKMYLE